MASKPPEVPPVFSMRIANGLYLDNNNQFQSSPGAEGKVYDIAGGALSLSTQIRGQVLSGTLAVLPLKDEPGWKGKLRDLGVAEPTLELFGDIASIAGNIASFVGYAQAALQFAQMVGFLKAAKSVEQLAMEILNRLGVVQDMVADSHGQTVKLFLESSSSAIAALRGQCETEMNLLGNYDVSNRRQRRITMLAKVDDADDDVRAILSDSRWELFNQSKQYTGSWSFMSDPEERTLTNPPWWGRPRSVPRQRLSDDGLSWVDATYPPAYKPRFDYRAAFPFAVHGITSYLSMLKMADPEFRSTGRGRPALLAYADALAGALKKMRAVLVRTHYHPYYFQFAGAADDVDSYYPDGLFGSAPPTRTFRRPHFYWQVGALDLCAHTDSYFSQLGVALHAENPGTPLPTYKLGTLDFDWIPPSPDLRLVPSTIPAEPPNDPHWEIANPAACADAANRPSEADFVVLLQSSGYIQLAQLEATLRHLATDPTESETVVGDVAQRRRRIGTRQVQATGYSGLDCPPEELTATGTLEEYEYTARVRFEMQAPDRVDTIPTRILLVALSAAAGTIDAAVLSEVELHPGPATVTLPKVRTFDWYVEMPKDQFVRPTLMQVAKMEEQAPVAFAYTYGSTAGVPAGEVMIEQFAPSLQTGNPPSGQRRHFGDEAVTLACTLTLLPTDRERRGRVQVVTTTPGRNCAFLYVVVEETLGSGKPLRTHFDLGLNTQLTFLPPSFFKKERDCVRKTLKIVNYIQERELTPGPPPHVPVTIPMVVERLADLRRRMPAAVEAAAHVIDGHTRTPVAKTSVRLASGHPETHGQVVRHGTDGGGTR